MATKKTGSQKITKKVTVLQKESPAKAPFPIVGIGASAGGLEALENFFLAVPDNLGVAFVVVSHLDPNHSSILPELIQKKTDMVVHQVLDNMEVVPNQVFVIPPNKVMVVISGTLQLLELSKPRQANLPIDIFFRSLAQDQGENAIGIILSGTGTDGTAGIKDIKGEGGTVMVQNKESAKYDGMPSSAIATGLADYVIPPGQMPSKLLQYVTFLSKISVEKSIDDDKNMLNALPKVYALLRATTGHDFSQYKNNTICRRIEKRMHVLQLEKIDEYVRYLQDSDQEKSSLFKNLLIGVTSFFRDSEAFEYLRKLVQDLLRGKADDSSVRVWVPGCSNGEEAYSIAILVQECMESIGRRFSVQIFATDLDEEAINIARAGIYPESIAIDVNKERLKKYFLKDQNSYKVKKNIREMVVFATQNIIKDPPFTKLDLLSCRNLLIYFNQDLQKKLFPVFHYSLNKEGLLFLGSSESIGQFTNLFTVQEKKWKIFTSKSVGLLTNSVLDFSITNPIKRSIEKLPAEVETKPFKDVNLFKLLEMIIAKSDMSTFVVIDDNGNIIYVHGRTGHYLEPAEGEANLNVLNMCRPGLKVDLKKAISKVSAERKDVLIEGLKVQNNGGYIDVNITVKPLPDIQLTHRGLMLVIFDKVGQPNALKTVSSAQQNQYVRRGEFNRLADELQYTKENLQTSIEELETSNEELKSTNEELQSTNEELQSTNEELETSKEELQSLNEESITVNSELQGRINELVTSNDDMKNLLDATDIATIFLDIDLKVRRFTEMATNLVPLTSMDIGRSITHFSTKLKDLDLAEFASKVLQDLGKREMEIEAQGGIVYRMRVRPYRTTNNVIDGVVMVFDDITELSRLAQAKRLAAIVEDSSDAILLNDFDGKILAWNRAAEQMYGYSEAEALQMNVFDMISKEHQKRMKVLFDRLKKENIKPFLTERLSKSGKAVQVLITFSILKNQQGHPEFVASTEKDVSLIKEEILQKLTRG